MNRIQSTIRISILLVLVVSMFALLLINAVSVQAEGKLVKIGVLAKRGTDFCQQKWSPTANYLSDQIDGYDFAIVPLKFEQVVLAIKKQEVDFILANPALYVDLEVKEKVERVVTLVNKDAEGQPQDEFAGAIVTRAARNDIKGLPDLVGKRFIAVDPKSFGGWLAVKLELWKNGIKPDRDLGTLTFVGTHDQVIFAIADGRADAGCVRSNILERMSKEGKINLADFKILPEASHHHDDISLNLLHSTSHYPEWPLAKLRDTVNHLAEQVAITLIQMPVENRAAQQGSYFGWTIPQNYQVVHDCLKTLKEPPYDTYSKQTPKEALRQFWPIILGLICVILIISLLSYKLLTGNRQLKIALEKQNDEILKRRQAEAGLQESEAYMTSLFRAAPAGIGVVIDRVFKDANLHLCEMLGYAKEELLGESVRSLYLTDEDYEYVGREKYRQIEESGTGTVETRLLCKDGSVIDVLLSSTPFDLDNLAAGMTCTATDITSIKNTERQLEQSQDKFRVMMEAMLDPVYIGSDDFKVEYMNPAMIKRCGRDGTGEFCYQVLHDFDQPCSWCKHQNDSRGKYSESEIVSPKDNRSYLVSHSPIVNEDGSISSLNIFRDTTEFKEMEAQFHQSQKMEAIGTLAGGVAHDFNNILTVIQGHAQLGMMQTSDENPLWNDLVEIENAGDRAVKLTRQLLAFSRKQAINPEMIMINNTVNDLGKMLRRLIGEDLNLKLELGEKISPILADPGQLEQIIINLVVNAADAVKEQPPGTGRDITIATSEIFLDNDFIASHADSKIGWHLLLEIADNGCGIAKEVMAHIFEPFYTTKEIGKGTGLGLSTVYGIVKQNCAVIDIESEEGSGTTFKIFWPTTKSEATEIVNAETLEPVPGGSEVILLAEDDDATRTLARQVLQQAGYTVIEAENGRLALTKAEAFTGSIDLLFTDIVMPLMGGKELNEKLTTLHPRMEVLFTSGYLRDRVNREESIFKGNRFINKPYNVSEVLRKIRHLLDVREV